MRVGQNPAKSVDFVTQPEKVTVAVVSYIPTLGGYYTHSLEVLQTCLGSIWENTHLPYDLLVFDNASCPEVRTYLSEAHAQGKIQYLALSEKNIGKAGAWNFIFGAAPGEFVAYADSDVYHFPGWLEPQIGLLEAFPQAGMVTGMPMWTPAEFSTATVAWLKTNPDVSLERGKFLPWEDYWRHARSLGAEEAKARAHFESVEDVTMLFQGQRYYVGAAHFQFVARKAALRSVLPIPSERPMGQVRLLDIALNERGYLRFCTPDWWVQHMGNTLQDEYKPQGAGSTAKPAPRGSTKFWRLKPVRKIVNWLYHQTFEILYRE
ncbi:MAG: glycosyltransferase family A protein [Anaerolineales bacterium]